jgi:transposase
MSLPQIGLPSALRIYLALEPVDMRKQYDGLWALAAQHLGLDPKTGALFVFTNNRAASLGRPPPRATRAS